MIKRRSFSCFPERRSPLQTLTGSCLFIWTLCVGVRLKSLNSCTITGNYLQGRASPPANHSPASACHLSLPSSSSSQLQLDCRTPATTYQMSGRDGRAPSGPWTRLKPVTLDPLEGYGLPSKGDNRYSPSSPYRARRQPR